MKKILVALLLAVPLAAQSQTYPNKPIRWVVPYTGGPEQAAKFLADEISKWSKVITTAGVKAE